VRTVSAGPPDAAAFRRFGRLLEAPAEAGVRADYSECLAFAPGHGLVPRLHVNRTKAVALPHPLPAFERHPHNWQTFLPLDVARFVVVVAGTGADGTPDLDDVQAFVLPGTVGVSYAPTVWHAPAATLDRDGAFAVVWPRTDTDADTAWHRLPSPLSIVG
jgi:ureidoglycolate lyase